VYDWIATRARERSHIFLLLLCFGFVFSSSSSFLCLFSVLFVVKIHLRNPFLLYFLPAALISMASPRAVPALAATADRAQSRVRMHVFVRISHGCERFNLVIMISSSLKRE
jgi:hypothetical protein